MTVLPETQHIFDFRLLDSATSPCFSIRRITDAGLKKATAALSVDSTNDGRCSRTIENRR